MILISLATIPNQSLSIRLSDHLYNIIIKETNGCMSATVVRDNITILSNTRIVAGFPIIPYRYLEAGNFIVTTLDDELPYWDKFQISQFLIYASGVELLQFRGAT